MYVDSHCHLDFPELRTHLPDVLRAMSENAVSHALCVAVNLEGLPDVLALAREHDHLFASVGIHPDYELDGEPDEVGLAALADAPKVVAIGETGLDYYRLKGDLEWQRERFRRHIRAARATRLPIIVHTRAASEDTLRIMEEEGARDCGGVMHCFTETLEVAKRALDLGFCISFSGIVTFKSAAELREVAKYVPLERLLIETDSPYLAPVPFRGKTNQPAFVVHVAQEIGRLKALPAEEIGRVTSENFFRVFGGRR